MKLHRPTVILLCAGALTLALSLCTMHPFRLVVIGIILLITTAAVEAEIWLLKFWAQKLNKPTTTRELLKLALKGEE